MKGRLFLKPTLTNISCEASFITLKMDWILLASFFHEIDFSYLDFLVKTLFVVWMFRDQLSFCQMSKLLFCLNEWLLSGFGHQMILNVQILQGVLETDSHCLNKLTFREIFVKSMTYILRNTEREDQGRVHQYYQILGSGIFLEFFYFHPPHSCEIHSVNE